MGRSKRRGKRNGSRERRKQTHPPEKILTKPDDADRNIIPGSEKIALQYDEVRNILPEIK